MKKLAIIIPCYNCERCIQDCLNSLIRQTFTDFDIIIIDDGSTDATADMVKKNFDIRIKYFYQENSGVSIARNKGLSFAEGQYENVMFVDADDTLVENSLESFIKVKDEYKSDFIFSDWNEITDSGVKLNGICTSFDEGTSRDALFLYWLKSRNGGSPWAKLYSLSIIEEYKIRFIENLPYAEDYLFNLQYIRKSKSIKYIKKALYNYNCIQSGAGAKFRRDRLQLTLEIEDIKKKIVENLPLLFRNAAEIGSIEQMLICLHYYRNNNFSKSERFNCLHIIKKYFSDNGIGISKFINYNIPLRFKIQYIFMKFGFIL